jgi:hypothetical protein
MKKKAHIQNDDNVTIIPLEIEEYTDSSGTSVTEYESIKVEFIGDTMWLEQVNCFSTDPISEICLTGNQAKQLFSILSRKFLVGG